MAPPGRGESVRPPPTGGRIGETGRDRRKPMKNAAFDEFVRSQQQPAHPEVDWDKERDEWLGYLGQLYKRIQAFLKAYIDSGQILLEYRPIELSEENIGVYTTQEILLRIGRGQVVIRPVGTLLIGLKGRVDVVGSRGTASIVLVDERATQLGDMIREFSGVGGSLPMVPRDPDRSIKWEWKAITRPPLRRFFDLTKESFFQMIMEVANG